MKVVENWKPVVGYEGLYEVSDLGRVRSLIDCHGLRREKLLKSSLDKDGYLKVTLHKNITQKQYQVHRLVAIVFVEGRDLFKNQVNHINEVKDDNRAINLEWCDAKYNNTYGGRVERASKSKSIPIVQLTLDYKFIAKWTSSQEVEIERKYHKPLINKCCKHKRGQTGGYRWFYLTEYEEISFKVVTSHHPFRLALPYRA